jgi:hypothetical protein
LRCKSLGGGVGGMYGDELLHVDVVPPPRGRSEGVVDGGEEAVGVVEPAALKLNELICERLEADEVVEDNAGGGVVRAVVELGGA